MRVAYRFLLVLAMLLVVSCNSTPGVEGAERMQAYSDEPYHKLLFMSVSDGLVDYGKVAEGEQLLRTYLDAVGRFGPETTPDAFPTREDQLAYYLNAYNAIMLWKWQESGAAKSSPGRNVNVLWFVTDQWKVDGRSMTMDSLEQRLIRPRFKEPRIHFALVCGAISCPPLLEEPYTGEKLDAQLDSIGTRWFKESDGFTYDKRGLRLSSIFKWYRDDFDSMGGLAGVMEKYVPKDHPSRAEAIRAARENKIDFMGYDWSINSVRARPQQAAGR